MNLLSVVVPAFNDQAVLDKSLSTLLNQTIPPWEIIVVDDGSEVPLTVPAGVKLIRIERDSTYRGSSEAKNRGAAEATGDWLAFTDDDILHMPDAVESVLNYIKQSGREDILVTVFSLGVPEGLLELSGWKPGDSESMECLLTSFRDLNKLYTTTDTDGVVPSRGTGLVVGLVLDVEQAIVVSSEQHFGVINKGFFDSLGCYDSQTFKAWGFNNQDLCLRVVRNGGRIVSNVIRPSGEVLHCFHSRVTDHDPSEAKVDFHFKYGEKYSPFMLIPPGGTCIRK